MDSLNLYLKKYIPHNFIIFLIFLIYNITYLLYVGNIIPRKIYFLILFMMIIIFSAFFIYNCFYKKRIYNTRELFLGFIFVFMFFIISILHQVINNNICLNYLIEDLFRFFCPLILCFLIINILDTHDVNIVFDCLMIRFLLNFIIINYHNFNINNILSGAWIDADTTNSSSMESSLAHDFLLMEIVYLHKNMNIKAFISMAFCMFSMKRFSFIIAPLIMIFKNLISNKKVSNKIIIGFKILLILSPYIVLFLYDGRVVKFLYQLLGIDLNDIVSGRLTIFNIIRNNIPMYNGLGSINYWLKDFVMEKYGTIWNSTFHNDYLRIYLETSIIGVIVYSNNIVEISKKSHWHFLALVYLMFVAITSHIFRYFSVWIVFYLMVMQDNQDNERRKKGYEHRCNYGIFY